MESFWTARTIDALLCAPAALYPPLSPLSPLSPRRSGCARELRAGRFAIFPDSCSLLRTNELAKACIEYSCRVFSVSPRSLRRSFASLGGEGGEEERGSV